MSARKKSSTPKITAAISLRGARQHNLKGLDLDIPLGKLTVVTGPSGSGKSSLAFHTLYAEGQRRYVETFSPYVRQFFDRMDKPAVDRIDGIPPAIAIEQKNSVRTTRSTVGTLTEINDYLKLLYARLASGFDPHTDEEIRPDSPESAADWAAANVDGKAALVTFPVPVPPGTTGEELFPFLNQQGYLRILHEGAVLRTDEDADPKTAFKREVEVIQDRLTISSSDRLRLLEALETAFHHGKGRASIALPGGTTRHFSTGWTNPHTGFSLRAPVPSLFSFNNPLGACPKCRGFGRIIGIDLNKAVPDPGLSIRGGVIRPFQGERGDECQKDLLLHCKERRIDIDVPWEDLEEEVREWIYYGDGKTPGSTSPPDPDALWQDGKWYGVKGFFEWMETKAYKMHVRVFLSRYRSYTTCPECRGKRLQPEALCFRIAGKTLPDLWTMPVSDLAPWFARLTSVARPAHGTVDASLDLVLNEITSRLHYLSEVGLGYLTLDRPTRTLSGGEVERVNLTTCLGASLTGTLFVLDEPTVGLHPRDIDRLVGVMHGLRDKGNTLVVVEHEEAVMRAADEIVDLGPGSGEHGGEVLYQGPVKKPARKQGGTLPWLSGAKSISVPTKRRKPGKQMLSVRGASRHNLNKLDVDIPLGLFCCLTGVSGSGKSTFVHDVLYLNLARRFGREIEDEPARVQDLLGSQYLGGIELVDQSPVARTPRSTPAVFIGAFDPIRQLFALTDEAKARELTTGFFSFNSGEGRCDRCAGAGAEKVEMQFLSDLHVTCPDCNGRRYKASTLDIHYHGKSIADILDLTVDDAIRFYHAEDLPAPTLKRHRQIVSLLRPLSEVGLGYLRLGQPLNTLSGGEAQRLKLCQLLAGTEDGTESSKLLILDEPTTGLHFTDIERLLAVFQRLVDSGHSLLVIEHNLDVIKSADWILDLGPEAGANGGLLVGEGSPEHIAKLGTETARFLKTALAGSPGIAQPSESRPEFVDTHTISLSGARHHNLKNVSLEIPRDQFVVVSGLSGSGKSTLAFDILFAEGQRRFLDSMSAYARQFAEQLEKPEIDRLAGLPPTVAIEQRVSRGGGKSTVATVTELWNFIRLLYSKLGIQYCPDCHIPVEKQSLAAIENTLRGYLKRGPVTLLAPIIRGRKGYHTEVAEWALKQGFTRLLADRKFYDAEGFQRLERFKEHDIDVVVADLTKSNASTAASAIERALDIGKGVIRLFTPDKKFVLLSSEASCPSCHKSFDDLDPRLFSFNSPHGWCPECRGHGLVPKKRQRIDLSRFDSVLEAEMDADRTIDRMEDEELVECPACHGTRLNATASAVHLQGVPIRDVARLPIDRASQHFEKIRFKDDRESLIARDILPEIRQRLEFLQEVGLGYLQMDRSAKTLSGGESQRIRLAAQLGSNLRGVLYVLDEPTIGLHPRDNAALLDTLLALRDKGNSLVVVEHDEDTIARADHLIDLGPGAGRLGGQVVYEGKPPRANAPKSKQAELRNSPTWRALTELIHHPMRGERRSIPKNHPLLTVAGCRANNLKSIDLHIPLGRLTVLTGISGSGKSTLMHSCLAVAAAHRAKKPSRKEAATLPYDRASGFDKLQSVYEVDQSPIGKTSRSCPATYVKVFDDIRALFAQLPEARMRGFDPSRFSFNTEGGRCPECKGNGRVKLEMDFLPPTWVHCESCNGSRYNPATLEVTFRDKTIGDVLAMTIDEAAVFFESQPRLARPLKLLADTGLGYLQLGQPSPTLSGGEAQRIKLVSEIAKGRGAKTQIRTLQSKNKNLYMIEEPTVGLHLEDVKRLIDVLHRLVDEGHTVVVIEHHMGVAAEADHIIDIGPEAGDNGGTIIAQGTPEHVAKSKKSRTAPFLKAALQP